MTVTPTPSVTPLPEAPQRLNDTPAQFVAKADPFVAALDVYGGELQAVAEAAEANAGAAEGAATAAETSAGLADAAAAAAIAVGDLLRRSNSSLTMAAGVKTVHLTTTGGGFALGDRVHLVVASDETIRLIGNIDTFTDEDDFTVDVPVGGVVGTGGPYNNWLVVHGAFATPGATDAEVKAGVSAYVAMTPANMDAINGFAIAFSVAL